MTRGWIRALVVLACVGCAATTPQVRPDPPPLPEAPEAWPRAAPVFPFRLTSPRSLEQARATRHALQQLPPDHRFVLALADLSRLLSGEEIGIEARLFEGRWYLVSDERVLAEVSAEADFPELLAALARYADRFPLTSPPPRKKRKGAAETPAPFELRVGEALLSELNAASAAWATERTPVTIARTADAFASLAFELLDAQQTADAVYARAWAVAAMARATQVLSPEAEAILAHGLGYQRAAKERAIALAEDSPVRAFLAADLPALERLAPRDANEARRYLLIRRLILDGETDRLSRLAISKPEEQESIVFLRAHMHAGLYSALPALVVGLQSFARRMGVPDPALPAFGRPGPGPQPPQLFPWFEAALERIPARPPGHLFSTELEAAVEVAHFSTTVAKATNIFIKVQQDEDSARQLLNVLGPARHKSTQALETWLRLRVRGISRNFPPREMVDLLGARHPEWKGLALAEFVGITAENPPGNMYAVDAVKYFARRLDSRPSHRRALLEATEKLLLDLPWTERLKQSWTAVSGRVYYAERFGTLRAEADQLEPMIRDESVGLAERVLALKTLLTSEEAAARALAGTARPLLDELCTRAQAAPDLVNCASAYEALKDFAALHTQLEGKVPPHGRDGSQTGYFLRWKLAKSLRELGRADEAWTVIQPSIAGRELDVLYEAARIQLARGKRSDAIRMGEIIRPHPHKGRAATMYAGVMWRAGAPEAVARHLSDGFGADTWETYLSGVFIASHQERSDRDITASMKALQAKVHPNLLYLMARGMVTRGRRDLAVRMVNGLTGTERSLVDRYRWLSEEKSPKEALSWFRRSATGSRAVYASLAFEAGADDLLFDGLTAEPGEGLVELWEFRAAALARAGGTSGARYETVRKWFEQLPAEEWVGACGRVLLGLAPPEALIRAANHSPAELARAAYYLGVLAEGRGRYDEAAEWYLDAVDIGGPGYARRWASDRLSAWRGTGKSLATLAAENRRPPAPEAHAEIGTE